MYNPFRDLGGGHIIAVSMQLCKDSNTSTDKDVDKGSNKMHGLLSKDAWFIVCKCPCPQ